MPDYVSISIHPYETRRQRLSGRQRLTASVRRRSDLPSSPSRLLADGPHADFGQGAEGGKLPAKAIANIREALIRMLGKAPELPEATAVQWPLFLELAPEIFRRRWGPAIGRMLIDDLQLVLGTLPELPKCLQQVGAEDAEARPRRPGALSLIDMA